MRANATETEIDAFAPPPDSSLALEPAPDRDETELSGISQVDGSQVDRRMGERSTLFDSDRPGGKSTLSTTPTTSVSASGKREPLRGRPKRDKVTDHLDVTLLTRLARERQREGSVDFGELEERVRAFGRELNNPAYSDWSAAAYYRLLGLHCTAYHQVKHRLYQHLLFFFGVPAGTELGLHPSGTGPLRGPELDPLRLLLLEAAQTGDDSRLSALASQLSGPAAVYFKEWLAVSRAHFNLACRIDQKLEMTLRAISTGATKPARRQVSLPGAETIDQDIRDPGTACLLISPGLSFSVLRDLPSIDFADTARARLQMHALLDFFRQTLSGLS